LRRCLILSSDEDHGTETVQNKRNAEFFSFLLSSVSCLVKEASEITKLFQWLSYKKVSSLWASLPGAGFGQPENSLDSLQQAFVRLEGQLI
jgi:hypothetical protein